MTKHRGIRKQTSASAPAQLQSRWAEIGTLGLQSYSGFVTMAYNTELNWPGVYPLYNRIRRSDPEISVIREIYGALSRSVSIDVELPDDPTPAEEQAAELYESTLLDVSGGIGDWLEQAVNYAPFMGWAWWEVVPGLRRSDWRPPSDDDWRSQYDDGLVGVRRLAWRDHSSFQQWSLDDTTGRLLGMVQSDFPNPAVTLPIENSLHVTFGDNSNPEGMTPLEAIWRLERIKYGLEVINGIGFEHSAGHLSVTLPGKVDAASKTVIQNAARAIMTAQEGNYAAWPEGIKGELIDVPFSSAPSILEAIRYYGLLKLQLYNMQWVAIASTAGTGAYAAMSDASQMFLTVYNAMVAGFVNQFDRQVGRRLYDWNAGAFPGARRPHFVAKPLDKFIGLGELGSFLQTIAGTMPMGDDDWRAIREKSGFLPKELPETSDAPTPEPAQDTSGIDTSADDAEDSMDDADMSKQLRRIGDNLALALERL